MLQAPHNSHRRPTLGALALLLITFVLVSCGGSNSNTPPTPTAPSLVQFSPVTVNIPAAALNSPVTGPLPDNTILHVDLTFKVNAGQQGQLNKTGSGKGQDLEKQANSIGISDATYQQIKAFLGIQDAKLTLSKLHTDLKVDAKAKTIATLFQTHFVIHKYQGRTFYAPASTPKLPTFIANQLITVTGLDNYGMPFHTGVVFNKSIPLTGQTHAQTKADCSPPSNQVFPKDVADAYGYAPFYQNGYHGENLTINLVEIDGATADDIQNYGQCVGFQGHIAVKDIDGTPTQAEGESVLDIEMIEGLDRNANIVDYETGTPSSASLIDELQQIVDDNTNNAGAGNVVSISLGAVESAETLNDLKALDQRLSMLTQLEHMTVFVSSGDCGAFADGVYKSFSVQFPTTDPNVVSVGGTVLHVDNQSNRTDEIVWSDGSDLSKCTNSWGSGGGNSNYFPQPSWQTGPGVQNDASRGFRQIPDVSAVAANLAFYFGGQWVTFPDGEGGGGGTSAAAPIWASGMLLVNEALIQHYHVFFYGPSLFYYVSSHAGNHPAFYDVTQGNNLGFNATPGWDFATGLGTPNLVNFYNVLASVASQQ
ncbi:MAG TPA: S53 family peptidase [Ktedonobacteraceae bacterium]|jgi:kumamolisin|nr:S53 family peptidase [Ktedonobacteraceae bacterium]